jgi:hypothetical protein
MKKPEPKRYSEQGARFDQALKDALSAPQKPLKSTATLKRRALRKKPAKPGNKKTGKGACYPGSFVGCVARQGMIAAIVSGISAIIGPSRLSRL